MPGHTFIASALAVVHAGATPVFCDVDDATGLIDAGCAAAVDVLAHRGDPARPPLRPGLRHGRRQRLARRHGLFVLEDAAQAHGATLGGRRAGALRGRGGLQLLSEQEPRRARRRRRDLHRRRRRRRPRAAAAQPRPAAQGRARRGRLQRAPRRPAGRAAAASSSRTSTLATPPAGGRRRLPRRARRRGSACSASGPTARASTTSSRSGCRPRRCRRGAARATASRTGVHYYAGAALRPPGVGRRAGAAGETLPIATAWAREELSLPMFGEIEPGEIERVIDACDHWLQRSAT